jgi:hypothetical protein
MTAKLARFHANGTLRPDDPAYVERRFEREMFSDLSSSTWTHLLGPRKYGKSSALMRLRARLLEGGYSCAFVDLQKYGGSTDGYAGFLEWFADCLAVEFGTTVKAPSGARSSGLEHWLRPVAPDAANMAVFIDEASGVPGSFRTTFFAQLRALHNMRSQGDEPAGELSKRLVFAFAGTFIPARMISNKNSPFNVSQESSCEDLTLAEVSKLAALGLGGDHEPFARRAFEETWGQPYYVQHLFAAVQRAVDDETAREEAFDFALRELQGGANGHLEDLTQVVESDDDLRALVPRILSGELRFRAGDSLHHYAIVSGIARNCGGTLVPRNPIYAEALARFQDFMYPA